jgi:PhnB protein
MFMMKASPEGYQAVTAHLVLADADGGIRFYRHALGAIELYRMRLRNGKIAHAELQIGNSRVRVSDDGAERGAKSALGHGGSPTVLCIYTHDVARLAERFLEAGGTIVRAIKDQFYGDRSGLFQDPEGYRWTLAQHIEDVRPEEMARRIASLRPS